MENLLNESSALQFCIILFLLAILIVFFVHALMKARRANKHDKSTQDDVTRAILNLLILDRSGLLQRQILDRLPGILSNKVDVTFALICLSHLVSEGYARVGHDGRYLLTQPGREKLRRDTARESRRMTEPGSPPSMLN
jgi:hypothetical protein